MDASQITVPFALFGTVIIFVAGLVWRFSKMISSQENKIELIFQRLTHLEGADDKDKELRIASLEKRMDEIANHANVSDWNRFRATIESKVDQAIKDIARLMNGNKG